MIILKLKDENIKSFMNKLLKESTFDNFETRGIEILGFTKIEMSCQRNKSFYTEEATDFLSWLEMKEHVLNFIKGKKTPVIMKFIFSIPDVYLEKIHNNAKALYLNIQYENGEIVFITGVQQKVFAMDKSLDIEWDEYVKKFMNKHEIDVELVE